MNSALAVQIHHIFTSDYDSELRSELARQIKRMMQMSMLHQQHVLILEIESDLRSKKWHYVIYEEKRMTKNFAICQIFNIGRELDYVAENGKVLFQGQEVGQIATWQQRKKFLDKCKNDNGEAVRYAGLDEYIDSLLDFSVIMDVVDDAMSAIYKRRAELEMGAREISEIFPASMMIKERGEYE